MEIKYTIDSNNAVSVFYDDSPVPSLYQPNWPNGDSWSTYSEAKEWAELYVASILDDEAPYAPIARGTAGHPKPTVEQKAALDAAYALKRTAITPEEQSAANAAIAAAHELFTYPTD